jgi:hypothetical protein
MWDIDLLYYPWGDARWRPYFLLGAGVASFQFADIFGVQWDDTTFVLPVGTGLKYYVNEVFVIDVEIADRVVFGGGGKVKDFHNLTLTAGGEFRFGGRRRAYWPWNPSRTYW